MPDENIDIDTVEGFGEEWQRFDQQALEPEDHQRWFDAYFRIFPWDVLREDAAGFDAGCGSGRWARLVARRVGVLHCVDASGQALAVARRNLADATNVHFHQASVQEMPLAEASMDFGYSLGVLHHVPDTQRALEACVSKLKRGAPFLCYLYYAFDNRPAWFRRMWQLSDYGRRFISRLPHRARHVIADSIAYGVYAPLTRVARIGERWGLDVERVPLAAYRRATMYTMRTDALDRFGTRLEQRFTAEQIQSMLQRAGLVDIRFSDQAPYWCSVGFRA